MMDYISKHFLVISAILTVFGSVVSTIFIAGYIFAFDSKMIWIIEYQDLIKFTLIGIAILSASAGLIINLLQDGLVIYNSSGKYRIISIFIVIFGLAILFSIQLLPQYYAGNFSGIIKSVYLLFASIMIIISVVIITNHFNKIKSGNAILSSMSSWEASLIIGTVYILGYSYGFYIKGSNDKLHDIVVKDKSNFKTIYDNSNIILILSHHAIFEQGINVIVIPTADIVRIRTSKNKLLPLDSSR